MPSAPSVSATAQPAGEPPAGMTPPPPPPPPPPPSFGAGSAGGPAGQPPTRWQRFAAASVRGFHAYGNWLVGISWKRFFLLSLLLLILMGVLHDMPPFTWTVTQRVEESPRTVVVAPREAAPAAERPAAVRIEAPGKDGQPGVDIRIDGDGVRITPRRAEPAEPAASAPADPVREPAGQGDRAAAPSVQITLPADVAQDVREAVDAMLQDLREAAAQARREAEDARREADAAGLDAATPRVSTRTVRYGIGDTLMQLSFLWVIGSAILKITYKGRVQAERQAAQATEAAEAEALRRQVAEARMAAMQAQVEPHFLFNTLASIDHLIETDPPRASRMQKNLIALLRASMPTLREANGEGAGGGVRDLGRELSVIRPYLEILKVRMEERLETEIAVPEGLLSAQFPPMMIQTLVENAIKHGLEPKAEGGSLRVSAEIVHGKLAVTVADTGLGFGRAATAGTGVGLANVRERLKMLYGTQASLTLAENRPAGTVATITVPYRAVHDGA